MITNLEIQHHYALQDQSWQPHKGLNIITSTNGGGKTSLLEYIYQQNKTPSTIIRKVFHSVNQFECMTHLYKNERSDLQKNYKSWIQHENYQNFQTEHLTLFSFDGGDGKEVDECNKFLKNLGLHIELINWKHNYGKIQFRRTQNSKTIEFSQISTGEKTAFILWLILESNPKPNVILFDEFDSAIDEDIVSDFYKRLITLSEQGEGVQIFIATHRMSHIDFTNESDINKYCDKYSKWSIDNGAITQIFND